MTPADSHDRPRCFHRLARAALSTIALLAAPMTIAQSPAPLPNPNLELWNSGNVAATLRLADGSLIVGGGFESVYDPATQLSVDRRGLAKFTASGALDLQWSAEIDCLGLGQQCVQDLALDANGGLLVAGFFPTVQGEVRRAIRDTQQIPRSPCAGSASLRLELRPGVETRRS